MSVLKFPMVRMTIFLSIGIVLSNFFIAELKHIIILISVLSVNAWVFSIWCSRSFFYNPLPDISFSMVLILSGMLVFAQNKPSSSPGFFGHFISPSEEKNQKLSLKIIERLKPGSYYQNYIARVENVGSASTNGKLLLRIRPDSAQSFTIGQRILTTNKAEPIPTPLNPEQFNYRNYMALEGVLFRLSAKSGEIIHLGIDKNSPRTKADQFRKLVLERLKKLKPSDDGLSIIAAMLLGQRQDIDRDLGEQYAKAGIIHILAISGLHVGILLLIFNFLLQPLILFKYGRLIKTILIILLLWSFALIAGFSPSVLRAVTMFSLFAISMNLGRQTNSYNTLATSAFILLILNPHFLFQVGFQMSYTAVLGILSFEPILSNFWIPKWKILNMLWRTLTVSVSAQLGVLPLSLYYFHQFPGLFMLSNLIVLPLLGFILSLGLINIFLAFLDCLVSPIAQLLFFVIDLLNDFVALISGFDAFIIKDIRFDLVDLFIGYLLIISFFYLLKKPSFLNTLKPALLVISFQLNSIVKNFPSDESQLTVFHQTGETIVGLQQGNHFKLLTSKDSLSTYSNKMLANFELKRNFNSISRDSLFPILTLGNKTFYILDSTGIYQLRNFNPNYVLITGSPKLNLDRLIDSLKPQQIVADGSNYHSFVKRWKESCKAKKIPFHHTGEKGAFMLNY